MLRQSVLSLLPRALWLPVLWLAFLWLLAIDFGHATTAAADDAMPQKTLVLPGEVFIAGGHTAFLLTPAAESVAGVGGIYPVYDWRTYPGVS